MATPSLPPPIIVHNRGDVAALLAQARRDRGMTCEALDFHAGFSDRYTAKMEHGAKPSGRRGIWISPMAEVWLAALGKALLLVDLKDEAMARAVRCPVTQ
jgi:hypothetical protein